MSLPIISNWRGALARSGVFHALSSGNSVAISSSDGYSWASGILPGTGLSWAALADSGTLFCAVANGTNIAATSPDGITWTARTLPASGSWGAIAWNGTVFCAVNTNTNQAATSPDGITWTSRTLPLTDWWQGIAWNGTVFCVISNAATSAATSPDGITWTARSLPAANDWQSITWNGTVFCIAPSSGTNTATSPDGITWTVGGAFPTTGAGNTFVAWNGSVFCAVGDDPGGAYALSSNGLSWTAHTLPVAANWQTLVWNGTHFCTLSATTALSLVSADGLTWASAAPGTSSVALPRVYAGPTAWGSATALQLTAAGVVSSGQFATSVATLQEPAASGVAGIAFASAASLLAPIASGSASSQPLVVLQLIVATGAAESGSITTAYQVTQALEPLAAYGFAASGASAQSSASLLPLTGSGSSPTGSSAILQNIVAVSNALAGQQGSSAAWLAPVISGASTASTPVVGASAQTLREAVSTSAGIVGVIGTSNAALARMILSAQGYAGTIATSVATLPLYVETSAGYIPAVGQSVSVSLPLVIAAGTGLESTGANFSAIVMHTESQALSTYTNFPFNSFAKFNGVYLGASDTGIFALTGVDDAGVPISSVARVGVTDFGTTRLKRVDNAYVGYRTTGDLVLRVTTDEAITYDYPLTSTGASGLHGKRAQIGKGLSARYWQFEIQNTNGADFELNSIDIKFGMLKRRVGGGDG